MEEVGGRSSRERRDEFWRWIKAPQELVSSERPGGDLGTGRASPAEPSTSASFRDG